MMSSHPDGPQECPSQADIDSFRQAGVAVMSLAQPLAMKVAFGHVAPDGRFEPDLRRDRWFVFNEVEAEDMVFWQRKTGRLTTWSGRAFALGQAAIDEAATYSFDCSLNIFDDPLDWLRSRRDGIVVLDWTRAFDRLRDAPRIALAENLLPLYRRHMRPAHMPELSIIPAQRRAA
jgi:hypothetical protein